jgi:integrase
MVSPRPTGSSSPEQQALNSDYAIMETCVKAASAASLCYGRANGFTLHSLRHTFITELMKQTNNDVGTVMKYSGHKSLTSFSRYLHPSETGSILAIQALDNVDGFLTGHSNVENIRNGENASESNVKPLQIKQVAS